VLFSICNVPWVIEACEFHRHELLRKIELSVHLSQRGEKDLYRTTNISLNVTREVSLVNCVVESTRKLMHSIQPNLNI
jgi:hypothetical protein